MEKASIQLRLLEHTKLVLEDAIEQVSNQYRMYLAVIFGLLAGLLSIAASIIRRALEDHNTHKFVDDMATYIGPSVFNSIALSGALVWFARSLHGRPPMLRWSRRMIYRSLWKPKRPKDMNKLPRETRMKNFNYWLWLREELFIFMTEDWSNSLKYSLLRQ
jgi:hypothetical protein